MESLSKIDITILILLGCLGMIVLAVSVILFVVIYQKKVLSQRNEIQLSENRHQKDLINATILVTETERERIAKNIHDDIGTLLNVIKLNMSKMSRNADDKQLTLELLKESSGMLEESIENIRGISRDLMPPTLVKLGYQKAISDLCRQVGTSASLAINLHVENDIMRLPPKTELQLYRITKEIINNIVKHAQATVLEVMIKASADTLLTAIHHNGRGISSEMAKELSESDKGIGLKSIQSRAQMIDASVQYIMIGEKESRITIEVPVYEKEN